MENLKPIGVRLDPQTIEALDKFCLSNYGYKRNTVINCLLTTVMTVASKQTIRRLIQFSPYFQSPEQFEITFKNKLLQ